MIREVRRIPPQRLLPETTRPQPMRVPVTVDADTYGAVADGVKELRLPSALLSVGDIVHLVELGDDGMPTGRCCYRLVTRKHAGLVTVLSATGQCEGRHE